METRSGDRSRDEGPGHIQLPEQKLDLPIHSAPNNASDDEIHQIRRRAKTSKMLLPQTNGANKVHEGTELQKSGGAGGRSEDIVGTSGDGITGKTSAEVLHEIAHLKQLWDACNKWDDRL